jgi:hypothetical protein
MERAPQANLLALPGLNLRILMDWVLDSPFRNDIAVLAPDPTERLQRAHFEPGDEVIRQGDEGQPTLSSRVGWRYSRTAAGGTWRRRLFWRNRLAQQSQANGDSPMLDRVRTSRFGP